MEQIKGYVTKIIFRNEQNYYTVFSVMTQDGETDCKGTVPQISEGESCELEGEMIIHPLYGEQFKVSSYHSVRPQTKDAVLRYLSSGAIKGVGQALASRIVTKFGDDTMRIIDEEPERLAEVRGISLRKAREIAQQVEEKRDVRDALLYLSGFGVSNQKAVKIWQRYGLEMYTILQQNPYRLAEDIDGIGFQSADKIASQIGLQPDSDVRIRSGLLYCLQMALGDGSCCLPRQQLIQKAAGLLQVDAESVSVQLNNLSVERQVYIRQQDGIEAVYSAYAYRLELQCARMLLDLKEDFHTESEEEILAKIDRIERKNNLVLDDLQRKAVLLAAQNSILILTGGPGTGKTTTINTIIRYFISEGDAVLLAAPTGRAAKRMTEATGYEAMTIHRMLGQKHAPDQDNIREAYQFEKDESNPLEADVLIVDEVSMVDLYLFNALLKALQPGMRLILSGDVNQLPSVGPGRILRDLIDSGCFQTVVLQKIFRQAAQSDIVMNAHRILRGEEMVLNHKSRDFFFMERDNRDVILKLTVELLRDKLPRFLQVKSGEIQVLTPMRKGALGVEALNRALQSVLNPPASGRREYEAHDVVFREGDKVMQIRNNYQMEWTVRSANGISLEQGSGIFNGDFGIIQSIDTVRRLLVVRFDDNREVGYPFENMDDLDLAYAITVHKSQGSEYPAVIMPLLGGPPTLLNRNLLYTAITRARRCVVILGSRDVLHTMEMNTSQSARYSGLRSRLQELSDNSVPAAFLPLDDKAGTVEEDNKQP